MNKQLIKLCLASILSLAINADLMAQELPQPTFTQEEVTEDISEAVNSFIQKAQAACPKIEMDFSKEEMSIGIYEIGDLCDDYFETPEEEAEKEPEANITQVFAELSGQPWLGALKSLKIGIMPEDISVLVEALLPNMPQLKILHFNDLLELTPENLEALTPVLTQLPNLHTLDFGGSSICENFVLLAPILAQAPNLQHLYLQSCGITVDAMINFMNTCHENGVEAFPNMQTLNLLGNDLFAPDPVPMQALTDFLSLMPGLQELYLSQCGLKEGLMMVAPAIAQMHGLQKLMLAQNGINESSIVGFVNALMEAGCADFSKLRELSLDWNKLGQIDEAGAEALVAFLSATPNLQKLNLSYNNLGERVAVLAPAIAQMKNLQKLNLRSNDITAAAMLKFAQPITTIEQFEGFPELLELNLADNKLGELEDGDPQALAVFLGYMPNLQRLLLENNDLGEAIAALPQAFSLLQSLQRLDLQDNNLDEAALIGFALACEESFTGFPELLELNLFDNNFGEIEGDGPQALLRLFSIMPKLQTLSLSSSNVDESLITSLGRIISEAGEFEGFPNLQKLDLAGNLLGTMEADGIRSLVYILAYMPQLQTLTLTNTGINESTIATIWEYLTEYLTESDSALGDVWPELMELELGGNSGFGEIVTESEAWPELAAILAALPKLNLVDLSQISIPSADVLSNFLDNLNVDHHLLVNLETNDIPEDDAAQLNVPNENVELKFN